MRGRRAAPGAAVTGRWSLRARLLALVLAVTAAAWIVGGAVMVRAADAVAERMRDERLEQLAATVLVFARHELAEAAADGASDANPDAERRAGLDLRYRYQVGRGRQVLMHSPDAATDRPLAGHWDAGFTSVHIDGRGARAYVSAADGAGLQVQVVELLDADDGALRWPGGGVLALMLLSLALVGALAAGLLVRALRPVAAAEAALRARPVRALDPLPTEGLPDEMRPLLEALNDLLARSAERLSRESGFTALAAHELRTPLAALRMQVQVAMRTTDAERRSAQLPQVLASVDRCAHLIEQLLTLARVEQGGAPDAEPRRPVALRALAQRVIDDLDADSPEGLAVELVGPELAVDGSDFALGVLLRNLLHNARQHAGAAVPLRVELARQGEAVSLCVDDGGPGIAAADRARALERFVRLGRGAGVGLGLSIVRAVAHAHGAGLELEQSPLGGLRVRLVFRGSAGPAGSPGHAP